jgi:hypothetical protein
MRHGSVGRRRQTFTARDVSPVYFAWDTGAVLRLVRLLDHVLVGGRLDLGVAGRWTGGPGASRNACYGLVRAAWSHCAEAANPPRATYGP